MDPDQQEYSFGGGGNDQYDNGGYDPHQQQQGGYNDPHFQQQQGGYDNPPHLHEEGGYVDHQGYPPHDGGGGGGGGYPVDGGSGEYMHQGGYQEGDPQQAYHYDNDGGAGYVDNGEYQYDPQQGFDMNQHQQGTDYSSIPDILALNHYCATAQAPRNGTEEAKQQADLSWEPVREWLRNHSAEEVSAAAQQRGDQAMTALHFACRNAPPIDVVDVLLSIAAETAQWQDGFGWLPIHYACACGTETKVVKKLAEAYPESKTTVDRRGRTPLHFALGNSNPDSPVSPEVVILLSSSRAAEYADDSGMLPLHYACAYGASEETMRVLTEAYDDAITTMDRLGRTPLHFALSNAGRKAAPSAVRLLLSLHKEIVNSSHGSQSPLRVLADYATSLRKDMKEQQESVNKCLEHLLAFNPDPTADFFTALQSLPDWLREKAVVIPAVQTLLNEKIAQRFPTGLLVADAFVQILAIVFTFFTIPVAVAELYCCQEGELIDGAPETCFLDDGENVCKEPVNILWVAPLYIAGLYFLVRTILEILSLLALGAIRAWIFDITNWLDVLYIFVLFYWATKMLIIDLNENLTDKEKEKFRIGIALSTMVLWTKLLAFLRNTYIDFAVFLGGLQYVLKRLVAFLLCLCITLFAFSRMWLTVYQQTPRCQNPPKADVENLQCQEYISESYCDGWSAFLNVFTMLLGEVDDTQFQDYLFATILFVLFMFLVVILLANVLIAIVVDSFKIIQDERAAIVFWTNRLDFVAQMDAIANGPWKNRVKELLGIRVTPQDTKMEINFGRSLWKRIMDLYADEVEAGTFSVEFLCTMILRFVVVFFILGWLLAGLLTLGILWPPQIRERLFTSKVLKHSSDVEKEDELRKAQVQILKNEVLIFKDDLKQELAIARTHVVQLKSIVAERKVEMQAEMKHIKRIVAMLFEQQSSM